MLELTYKNHFKFGFNGVPFSRRSSAQDVWFAEFGPIERPPGSFKQECIATAKLIAERANAPLWLLFSGGIDSEVMLQSFVAAGVPFNVAINRFANNLNIHDVSYAVIACENLGVPYTIFDLDIEDFWRTKFLDYIHKSECCWPALTSTMWLMEQVPGYPVLGSGECFLEKVVPAGYIPGESPYEPSDWFLRERERIASWYRFLQTINKPGCAGFYQYTPEFILSFLQDPLIKDLTSSKIVGKLTTQSSKAKFYAQHFELLPRTKYSGFEKVNSLNLYYQDVARKHFPHHDQIQKMPYGDLVKHLRGNLK